MPDSPNSADTLGWAYYKQGVYDASVDLFQEAIKANPDSATYHYHLGLAYQKTNKFDLAKKELDDALKVAPNGPESDEVKKALSQLTQGS
jgi:tetratricopeptide (TPR) repeat protein